ncbi:leucine--tRNA ligase [Nocardia gipuzkoensis]
MDFTNQTEGTSYREVVRDLEDSIRQRWREETADGAFLDDDSVRPHRYVLGMFPYPSGKAHLGHILVYSIADALARLGRFKGELVLNPLGWDAFGLPAENAAIKNGTHPAEWTEGNIANMRDEQIGRAGFSFDLSQELNTSSPEFYRWTQWLFLKLYEHGQAYRAMSWVNWDPVDKTVLANEQVIDGRGWRSGAVVERRQMEQWCLRITDFAQDLHDGLDDLTGWSSRAVSAQRGWIGRSEGVEIDFQIPTAGLELPVFTTRPDTIFGVTSVTIAPEHPQLERLVAAEQRDAVAAYVAASMQRSELERQSEDAKTGVYLGTEAINPLTGEAVPVWVSDYVIGSYGTGAIMNVPAHDQRDFEFAAVHGLPVREVIVAEGRDPSVPLTEAFVEQGIMRDSGEFTGIPSSAAMDSIAEAIEARSVGRKVVRFRLRDWSIGRQRYWGCPIPMVRLGDGRWEPVPESQLPVLLPRDVDFSVQGARSPLATSESFRTMTLPDGEIAEREVDTMDTFMDSAWYAWRFLAAGNDEAWPRTRSDRWMPIDYYIGGLEHATQHMIYFRYISHFLHSIGLTPSKEPVVNFLDNGMIKLGGSKMSKSKGNTISPDEIIERYGADALRMYILSDAPFEYDREWDDAGLVAKQRFLGQIWKLGTRLKDTVPQRVYSAPPTLTDAWSREVVTAISTAAAEVAAAVDEKRSFHVAIAQLHGFASKLSAYSKQIDGSTERGEVLAYAFQGYLKMVGLFAPHLADTLWHAVTGSDESIFRQQWVKDVRYAQDQHAELAIPLQINGKVLELVSVRADSDDETLGKELLAAPPERLVAKLEAGQLDRVVVVRAKDGAPRLVNVVVK